MTTYTTLQRPLVDPSAHMRGLVAKGAKLLDRRCPDWFNQIMIAALHMNSAQDCILGQLYEHIITGVDRIRIEMKQCPEYGFELETSPFTIAGEGRQIAYGQLRQAWVDEIMKRRNPTNEN